MTNTGISFPTTDWGLLANVSDNHAEAKTAALDILIRRYWKPVYFFLRCSGLNDATAKDSTQAFFANWIEKDVFARADRLKGRFRSFMLSCLKRFVSNERRADHAQKRRPEGGLFSLDELMEKAEMPFAPVDGMTPEKIFDRAWATTVVMRVLKHLEQECKETNKEIHYDIFARRIIRPILEGSQESSLAKIGAEHGLTEKQAANHLLTAKRAYQRLLHQEVRLYADSETEVSSEVRDLFNILAQR